MEIPDSCSVPMRKSSDLDNDVLSNKDTLVTIPRRPPRSGPLILPVTYNSYGDNDRFYHCRHQFRGSNRIEPLLRKNHFWRFKVSPRFRGPFGLGLSTSATRPWRTRTRVMAARSRSGTAMVTTRSVWSLTLHRKRQAGGCPSGEGFRSSKMHFRGLLAIVITGWR